MKYFTADTHFFHKHLVHDMNFANRDFLTIHQMNETIINNWNNKLEMNDIIYHLGDIAYVGSKKEELSKILEILNRLNGKIIFLKGNHDSRSLFKFLSQNNFEMTKNRMKYEFHDVGLLLKLNHEQLFLTHYPLLVGPAKNRINLHGHIHNSSINSAYNINVGIDSKDLEYLPSERKFGEPLSEKEIFEIIKQKDIAYKKMR